MDGIKTAIVGFILVCLILPHIIKNRHQYYAAVALFLIGQFLIVISSVATFGGSLYRFCHFIDGLIDIAVILILVLASGGLTVTELAGNFAKAYEVIRRGEEEKEVIIPIAGQQSRNAQPRDRDEADAHTCYVIEDTLPSSAPPPPPPPENKEDKSLPLV